MKKKKKKNTINIPDRKCGDDIIMYDLRWIFFFYAARKPFTGESTRKCIGPGARYEEKKRTKKKKR